MNILVLGSGGREHALAWKVKQSPLCENLYVAPGNPGTAAVAQNIPVDISDFSSIAEFAKSHQVDLLVVGPEAPLVAGIRDYFENSESIKDVLIVGPGKEAAQLEGSKNYAKEFLNKYNIPTAKHATFTSDQWEEALAYLRSSTTPIVLKADGLAAGKGVIISESLEEAEIELRSMLLDSKFGEASRTVVIEEFLDGVELSVFILTDGKGYILLPEAKDYKRIGENDTGPNTGGMGALSPVPFADPDFMEKVIAKVIKPTVEGIEKERLDYRGVSFSRVNQSEW